MPELLQMGGGTANVSPTQTTQAGSTTPITPKPPVTPGSPTLNSPTQVSTPTPVVGSGLAANYVATKIQPTLTQGQTDLANQNAKNSATPQTFTLGDGNTYGINSKLINAPKTPPITPPIQTPTAPENTPGTAEHTLLNTPSAGNQYIYDNSGNRLEIPIGQTPPTGYSTTKPVDASTLPSTDSVTQSNGTVIKQFNDGTYGSFDATGKYQGVATADDFNQAKTAAGLLDNINKLINGTYPLTASQQAQVDSLKASFQQLITQQETANANFTGGTTVAENLYGMGTTISGLGEIKGTVDAGIAKIADLNGKMASAVAQMTQSFQDDNMTNLKAAYDIYTNAQKDRQDEIDKLNTATQAKLESDRNFNLQQAQDQFNNTMAEETLTLSQKKDAFDEYIQQADLTEKQKTDALDAWYKQQDIALRKQAQAPTAPGNVPIVQLGSNGQPLASSQAAFLQSLPQDVATMVKGLADYSINPTDYATRLNKGSTGLTRAQAVALAKQYDPTYDDSQWQSRQKLQNSFTSGTYSQNITALNTAVTHITDLVDNFAKLHNAGGLLSITNRPINALSKVLGNSSVGKAQQNITAAVDEMATAFKGSGATDAQIKSWEDSISPNMSPSAAKGVIEGAMKLLGDRLQNLSDTYTAGMGKPPENGFLHDSTAANLLKLQSQGYTVDIPALQDNPTVKLANAYNSDAATKSAVDSIRKIAPNATPEEILNELGIQ